ncbi:MAG: hypothetical protein LBQ52_03865, partial [Helicobacteraceae bacterium]|nr:hypothetical protein [Helicobacteraceae bacterium]
MRDALLAPSDCIASFCIAWEICSSSFAIDFWKAAVLPFAKSCAEGSAGHCEIADCGVSSAVVAPTEKTRTKTPASSARLPAFTRLSGKEQKTELCSPPPPQYGGFRRLIRKHRNSFEMKLKQNCNLKRYNCRQFRYREERFLNIHEFQAKEILRRYGAAVLN